MDTSISGFTARFQQKEHGLNKTALAGCINPISNLTASRL
jgi:hypothetical protein